MKKFILLFFVSVILFSCDDENQNTKIPGSTLYEEILPAGRVDTTLIRFVFQNEGNSKLTGKVNCSKSTKSSSGEYFKFSYEPLTYYIANTLTLNNKTVIYYQVDSLTLDTFRIKVSFPDSTLNGKAVKDSLVYKAFKKSLSSSL